MNHTYKILLIILIFTIVSLAEDWRMFRGNARRTGYYNELVGYPKETPLWQISLGSSIVSSPSIIDNTLYVGSQDSCVYAIDANSGKTIWRSKTGGWVNSSPLIYKNMIVVGSMDSNIYVFDKYNGDVLSTLSAGIQLSSPAMITGGTVISGMGPPFKKFSAYDPANPKWDITHAAWSVDFKQMSYSSPSVVGDVIAIGAGDGKLYGISITDKDTLWSLQTWGGVDMSTPAIDNGMVYFAPGNYDKGVYAVDLQNGLVAWVSELKKAPEKRGKQLYARQFFQLMRLSPAHRSIAVDRLRRQGVIVPASLVASSKRSKSKVADFFPYGGMKTSSVAVDETKVYVVQKELGHPKPKFSLVALDKTNGTELWRFSELRTCARSGYCSSPVVTNHQIFVGWGEGKLYAIKTETGEKVWEDSLSADIISSPSIADGKLYVATMDGNMYCYGLSETEPGQSFQKDTYCYPNPAKGGVSNIQVFVEKKATLELVVYNTAERPVYRVSKTLPADEKFVHKWNLSRVANGVYFAVIEVKYVDGGKNKKILKIAVLN